MLIIIFSTVIYIYYNKRKIKDQLRGIKAIYETSIEDLNNKIKHLTDERKGEHQLDKYWEIENSLRGPEEAIKRDQKKYLKFFKNCKKVVDLGCGRGEFLELLNENKINALGIDIEEKAIQICKNKGLQVKKENVFDYLSNTDKIDGIFASHLIEHLKNHELIRFIKACYNKLKKGGFICLVTPNSESLAAHLEFFYNDLTHIKFYPRIIIQLLLENNGFKIIEAKETDLNVYKIKNPQLSQILNRSPEYYIVAKKL
jgi:O-antigen chain-terminating methyltransferase